MRRFIEGWGAEVSFSIGIRVYKIVVFKSGQSEPVKLTEWKKLDFVEFISNFAKNSAEPISHSEALRTWYFSSIYKQGSATDGLISYGTHGFQSNFIDVKTRKKNYVRMSTDLEEIPLYFHIWAPVNSHFGMAAFQSFGARSCISYVLDRVKEMFEQKYNGYKLFYQKIMPGQISQFAQSPVKTLTLKKKMLSNDKFDGYLNRFSGQDLEYKVSLKAKRNSNLGKLRDLISDNNQQGVIIHDGISFDEMKAEVKVGNRFRSVTILGVSSNAGLIDISPDVKYGVDGHPILESIRSQVEEILSELASLQ